MTIGLDRMSRPILMDWTAALGLFAVVEVRLAARQSRLAANRCLRRLADDSLDYTWFGRFFARPLTILQLPA